MGEYTKVTIQQVQQPDGAYVYSVYLDETKIHTTVNNDPREFDNVKLFASDNYYPASKAELRYFNFQSPFFGKYSCR